jgi:glycosyltransferase involved in cell wall biosynthesis
LFPTFRYEPVVRYGWQVARLLRRALIWAPWIRKFVRPFFTLNWTLARIDADLVLFPVPLLDSILCDRPHIFCVADIAHVYYPHFPEVRVGNQLRSRDVLFRYGLEHATQVMVETEHLRGEIARYYDADPNKAQVIFQVLPRLFQIADHPDIGPTMPKPYLFYPAQLWAHKNHLNLLTSFAELVKQHPDLHLVLCGSRKPGDEAIFSRIAQLRLSERVTYLGYVPDERMPQLYRNAAALVMPTYFGPSNIPTLEAFAFGCPAVISDLPGVEEQVKDAALRFNPDDPGDMVAKLNRILLDSAFSAQLVAAGKIRAKELSYENYRAAMFRLFDAALARL